MSVLSGPSLPEGRLKLFIIVNLQDGKIAVSATVNIHRIHRQHTGGQAAVAVEGRTVEECLRALVERCPGMRMALFDGSGKLRNQIEIYLNGASAYPEELKKPVAAGDEIHITVVLAGG